VGPVVADCLGGLPGSGRTGLVASGGVPVHLRPPPYKLAAEAFIVEQLMGEGLGGLEAFQNEGEWILVAESFEMLRPYEQESSSMVDTLLDGLVELFDSL
jgi:hypothetical protein